MVICLSLWLMAYYIEDLVWFLLKEENMDAQRELPNGALDCVDA